MESEQLITQLETSTKSSIDVPNTFAPWIRSETLVLTPVLCEFQGCKFSVASVVKQHNKLSKLAGCLDLEERDSINRSLMIDIIKMATNSTIPSIYEVDGKKIYKSKPNSGARAFFVKVTLDGNTPPTYVIVAYSSKRHENDVLRILHGGKIEKRKSK